MKPTPHYQQLDYNDRITIAIGLEQGLSMRAIARMLNRPACTISREIGRNCGGSGYSCVFAQQRRTNRRTHSRPAVKLVAGNALFETVRAGLQLHWSPQQIAAHLVKLHPDEASKRASHETIYNVIYAQPRGALKRELVACLRMARAKRWPRSRGEDRRGQITDLLSIHVRPPEVADRQFPGHWEGDLIVGLASSAIGTLVERSTRFTMLLHLPPHPGHGKQPREKHGPALAGHGAEAVRDAITKAMTSLPNQFRRSLTWDQGTEMSQHAKLSMDTGLEVYFCDPQSPWQRGTNENTNGLLRQYFPKGTDLSAHKVSELNAVALALNTRPRKTLGWRTPAEAFNELLRSTKQSSVATTS